MLAPFVAFSGDDRVAAGTLAEVAAAARTRLDQQPTASILILDTDTGHAVDVDLRGDAQAVAARLTAQQERAAAEAERTRPGRPRLGVVAREVTLLPRHWDWLAAQPGGASVTLRKLVETARKQGQASERIRQRQDVAYRIMLALAGDRVGYEEAIRALYAWDLDRVRERVAAWPADVRDLVLAVLAG